MVKSVPFCCVATWKLAFLKSTHMHIVILKYFIIKKVFIVYPREYTYFTMHELLLDENFQSTEIFPKLWYRV